MEKNYCIILLKFSHSPFPLSLFRLLILSFEHPFAQRLFVTAYHLMTSTKGWVSILSPHLFLILCAVDGWPVISSSLPFHLSSSVSLGTFAYWSLGYNCLGSKWPNIFKKTEIHFYIFFWLVAWLVYFAFTLSLFWIFFSQIFSEIFEFLNLKKDNISGIVLKF